MQASVRMRTARSTAEPLRLQTGGDRLREPVPVLGVGEEAELFRVGEELALDQESRHGGVAQYREGRAPQSTVQVVREGRDERAEDLPAEPLPCRGAREVEDLDAFDFWLRGPVRMQAQEEIGTHAVGERRTRRERQRPVLPSGHDDPVAARLELFFQTRGERECEYLLFEPEGRGAESTRIVASVSSVDADFHDLGREAGKLPRRRGCVETLSYGLPAAILCGGGLSILSLRPRIVILGGGFGGLAAAQALARTPADVTLIDRRNFHLFQPLLYQVATGALSPGDIAAPLRSLLRRQRNTRVLLAEATDLHPDAPRVILSDGECGYDVLIVACGSHHHYFGHPEWERLAPGLKTVEDATAIRGRLLLAFEAAEREADPARRAEWLTFVIVGAGPTGVELAGALAEIAQHTLRHEFRSVDPRTTRILLVEGAERVLPPYPPPLSARATESLRRLGIEVRERTLVTAIDPEGVVLMRGERSERVAARTVVWAAGVAAEDFGRVLAARRGAELDRIGRVVVGPDLCVPGHPEIFVIGDLAHIAGADGQPLPGVAQVAIQAGRYAAAVIAARARSRPAPAPFRYRDRGSMAVIGRGAAIADFGWLRLHGAPAWLAWLFVHLMALVDFENRLLVFVQWAWDYFTWNRGARLITGENPLPLDGRDTRKVPGRPTE